MSQVEVPSEKLYFTPHKKYWAENVLPYVRQTVKKQGHIKVLELGVMLGSSTQWILENMIAPYPGSQYVGIDLFLEENRASFCKVNGMTPLEQVPVMMTSSTVPALIELAAYTYTFRDKQSQRYGNPKLFDLIYVDAGHSGSEVFV